MNKGFIIGIGTGVAAVFAVSCLRARAVADRLGKLAMDLRDLSNEVDSLDERTGDLELDMRYNVKRITDVEDIDIFDFEDNED